MSTMLVFRCPKNGHEVRSGIFTDGVSFDAMKRKDFVMTCPECGERHRWFVADGSFELPEEPRPPRVARIH